MTESETRFEVEVGDTTLTTDSTVAHVDHGPMRVESIRVGAHSKTVVLQSETGPEGLTLSESELRERWGESIHVDLMEVLGDARFTNEGISVDGADIEVTIETAGEPQGDAEMVHMHAIDAAVQALQAVRDGVPPSECKGADYSIDWESFVEDGAEGDDGE